MSPTSRRMARALLAVVSVALLAACAEPMHRAGPVAITVRPSAAASTLDARERQLIVRVYRHPDDDPERRLPVVFDDRFLGASTTGALEATELRFTPQKPRATVFLTPGTFTFEAVALEGADVVGRASADSVAIGAAGAAIELDFAHGGPSEP